MRRRDVLKAAIAAPALYAGAVRSAGAATDAGRVMTVTGRVPADRLGVTLAHEHALANFQDYESWSRDPLRYDVDEVVAVVLPRLARLKALGVGTFVDATAAYLGRDPVLLRRLSRESGLNIVTVTGNYAVAGRHLPPWVYSLSAEGLAERWIAEWESGIDGSGVKPGFMKLGFNGGPLSPVEQKLIHAAAIAHRRTGLPIGAHTGPAVSAFEQLAVLDARGVDLSAWIWIHAQNEADSAHHVAAARRGAWIEFDGIAPDTVAQNVQLVRTMADAGLLGRVLISQDAGWYEVGKPGGGDARSYETIFTQFVPALRAEGFGTEDIHMLLVTNPAAAFSVRAPVA